MPDEMDRAQEQYAKYLEARIENERFRHNAPAFGTPSLIKEGEGGVGCIDCGDHIPAARKKAAPGCVRCIGCQKEFEVGAYSNTPLREGR